MIAAGNDLKFRITTDFVGFSMDENDFSIVIKNRWGQIITTIPKNEFFQDTEGDFYFTVENVQIGSYFALFSAIVPDDDYDKRTRTRTDLQHIFSVGLCCNSNTTFHKCPCDHQVHYEQVWTTNIDGAAYLCDKDGNLILTADGKRIQFLTTPKTDEK